MTLAAPATGASAGRVVVLLGVVLVLLGAACAPTSRSTPDSSPAAVPTSPVNPTAIPSLPSGAATPAGHPTTPSAWECASGDIDLESGWGDGGPVVGVSPLGAFLLVTRFELGAPGSGIAAAPDGWSWTAVEPDAIQEGRFVRGMAQAAGQLVLVGSDEAGRAGVWTSRNGEEWDPVPPGQRALEGPGLVSVAHSAPGYVAVDAAGDLLGSVDGRLWAEIAVADGGVAESVARREVTATDGGFVVVGASGGGAAAWTSPDGHTWGEASVADPPASFAWVASSGPRLMAGGDPPRFGRWVSADGGTSWAPAPAAPEGPPPSARVLGLPGAFVAAGEAQDGSDALVIWTSPDGVMWAMSEVRGVAPLEPLAPEAWSVAANERIVALVGRSGRGVAPAQLWWCVGTLPVPTGSTPAWHGHSERQTTVFRRYGPTGRRSEARDP